MIPRFFCPLVAADHIELPEPIAHHALRVLRLNVGDTLMLFDGEGTEYLAVIESAGRSVSVRIESSERVDRESPLSVTLYQALPAGDKMDWVVQKAVELGVNAIVPVAAERSVLKLTGDRAAKRLAHWQSVAVSACEQCGRNRVPQVGGILPWPQALAACAATHRLILAPGGQVRLRDMPPLTGEIALFVGPEGGWSEPERAAARAAGLQPLSLGPRVLRTETAGLAALAALAARFGDF